MLVLTEATATCRQLAESAVDGARLAGAAPTLREAENTAPANGFAVVVAQTPAELARLLKSLSPPVQVTIIAAGQAAVDSVIESAQASSGITARHAVKVCPRQLGLLGRLTPLILTALALARAKAAGERCAYAEAGLSRPPQKRPGEKSRIPGYRKS